MMVATVVQCLLSLKVEMAGTGLMQILCNMWGRE